MTAPRIAIIGIRQQYQIQAVCEALAQFGVDPIILDVNSDKPLAIRANLAGIDYRYDGVDLRDCNVIWQCQKKAVPYFGHTEEWQENYIHNSQWGSTLHNLLMAIRHQVPIINDPLATLLSNCKLDQLQTTHKLGMAFPPSLISNSLGAIGRCFEPDTPLITKALGNPHIPKIKDGIVSQDAITTSRISRTMLETAEYDLDPHPSLIQAEISKQYEIRTVAVGDHLFSCKIDSHQHKIMELDYRMGAAMVNYQPMATPDAIKNFVRAYLDHYDLTSGSFDFIVDRTGEIIFLECNPEGIWGIIDKSYDGAIAQAFAQTLIARTRDR